MLRGVFLCVVTCLLVCCIVEARELPPNYEALPMNDKRNILWKMITDDFSKEGDWYGTLDMLQLFLRSDWFTGNVKTDLLPTDRKKLIHTVGAIAQAKFVWVNSFDYTGGFRGAKSALVRFSTATAAEDDAMTAGISIKILRDNIPSGNIIAMWALDGQKSLNFFEKPFSNRVAEDPNLSFKLRMLGKKFAIACKRFPGSLGLSAQFNEDGSEVARPKFPWALMFQPNPVLSARMQSNRNTDIPVAVYSTLNGTECVYKVFAVREPRSSPQYLGYLRLESLARPTKFGDYELFFKHTFMNDDFAYRPDWAEWFSDEDEKRWETDGTPYYANSLPAWTPCF